MRQGDGTYVTSLRPELLLEAVSFITDFHRDDSVLHFLAVRRLLEPIATAMTARRITAEQVKGLYQILEELPPESEMRIFVANDLEFHRRVVSYCGNPVLASLLDSISGPTNRARVWRGVTDENAEERTLREHLAILQAIERNDPEIAAALCTVHIAGLEDWLRHAG